MQWLVTPCRLFVSILQILPHCKIEHGVSHRFNAASRVIAIDDMTRLTSQHVHCEFIEECAFASNAVEQYVEVASEIVLHYTCSLSLDYAGILNLLFEMLLELILLGLILHLLLAIIVGRDHLLVLVLVILEALLHPFEVSLGLALHLTLRVCQEHCLAPLEFFVCDSEFLS